ncbi:folate-binding protein [Bombella sp. TMW 2.2559]|uniref:Folate-binding protein n=1 Tax=Bombella dulcis TaxID=2967339 RepID=A0ABT3W9P0_9PROT|nr:folate-binding protein [Bombella dulcis]MCX5615804.1 folate-binding protein [Bombella dulcis]
MKSLRRFRLRADVEIELLDGAIMTGAPDTSPPENAIIQALDPRHPSLGWRAIVSGSSAVNHDTTLLTRHLHIGVPSDEDIAPGQTLVLEANMDHLHGVSWTKGCYLGQEVTARTHYRGLIRKRILPIISADERPLPDEGIITSKGQNVGELRSHIGQHGLAQLHRKAWTASDLMLTDRPIKLVWPDWLPKDEDSHDEQGT